MSYLRSATTAALVCISLSLGAPTRAAQDKPNTKNDQGKVTFLVAQPELGDPMFNESVVLMFPKTTKEGLVAGLIVNKPTRFALGQVFADEKAFKDRTEMVYFGGPVNPDTVGVVFRSSKAVKQATQLYGDVYVSFDRDYIKELLKHPEQTPEMRVFVGRAQWAPAQLQNEMLRRAWYNLEAESSLLFGSNPEYLWRSLFERAEPSPVVKLRDSPSSRVSADSKSGRLLASLSSF